MCNTIEEKLPDPKLCEESHNFRLGYKILYKLLYALVLASKLYYWAFVNFTKDIQGMQLEIILDLLQVSDDLNNFQIFLVLA